MMHDALIYVGEVLAVIISYVTVSKFLYYTKSEINAKISKLKDDVNEQMTDLLVRIDNNHKELKQSLSDTKEKIFNNIVEAERNTNKITKEIYENLTQNKEIFNEHSRKMVETISQVKQRDQELSNDFLRLLTSLKDELKNDYITRYNDLINIIQNKVGNEDFEKLETKFDKIIETITELKTIVQIRIENRDQK